MPGKRWKEEQIIEILREAEKGQMSVSEICRKQGIADVTFYKWRKRYGGDPAFPSLYVIGPWQNEV